MVGVSIIIPIYNVEDYLVQCLESIVNQTYTNINVILVNDGSTDSSGKICDMYAKKFDFITAYHKENGGLISAWKYGLSHVTTEIISFVDPDDWINETYYEVLVKKFLDSDADIITSRVVMDFGATQEEIQYKIYNGLFVGEVLDEKIKSVFLSQGGFMDRVIPVTRWAKLIRKDLIENNLKYLNEKITYGEDLNIILPAILDSNRVYIHNEENATYFYRVRKDSMQHSYDRNKLFSVNEVYSSLMNIALDKNRNELRTQILTDYICASVQCYKNELNNLNYVVSKENLKILNKNSFFTEGYSLVKSNKFGLLNRLIVISLKYDNTFFSRILYYILVLSKRFN